MSLAVALGQVGYALGGGIAGPVYAELGYRIDTVIGALAVLGMGTMVWTLVPEPKVERPAYPTLDTLAEPVRVSVSGLSSRRHRSGWDRGSG